MKTIEQVKKAVDDGKLVNRASDIYEVTILAYTQHDT